MKTPYLKPPLTFQNQVQQLITRGLRVADNAAAAETLKHISYYRLSAYMYPFLSDKPNHIFKTNTSFDDVLGLYLFDKKLRALIFDAIAEIEISFRTSIVYTLAHSIGAFWISDANLFTNSTKHGEHLQKLKEEINRSDEKFLAHFRAKYSDPIPPVWMSLEIASFGLVSQLFNNIQDPKYRKAIARVYGLQPVVFASWIHTLAYIRNICAHHARLWNRKIRIEPVVPKSSISGWNIDPTVDNRRLFFSLAIISYFLNQINPQNHICYNIKVLLQEFPHADINAMGFIANWDQVAPCRVF